MVLASFQILNEAPDKSTRPVFLAPEATARLFELSLTLTVPQQSTNATCLRNPSQCCVTSSECSSTRILLCSIPHVVVEVHCERLNRWVQDMCWGLKLTATSRRWQNEP